MLAADKEAVRRIAAAACVAAIEARENAVAIGALAGNTAESKRSAGDPILQGCGLRMSRRFAEAEQGKKNRETARGCKPEHSNNRRKACELYPPDIMNASIATPFFP
ncbi:inosine/xanthosine triphosphate pyrophosphatase family protein [Bradyrhizobium sp. GM7.3]